MHYYCAYLLNTPSLAILSYVTPGERFINSPLNYYQNISKRTQLSKISLLKISHTSLNNDLEFNTRKVCPCQ